MIRLIFVDVASRSSKTRVSPFLGKDAEQNNDQEQDINRNGPDHRRNSGGFGNTATALAFEVILRHQFLKFT